MIDQILERFNLKYDQLLEEEKETLRQWEDSLTQNQLNIPKVREYVASMRDAVEKKIVTTSNNSKQDIFLKARLNNYMLLESLLTSPERARQAIENQLGAIKTKNK